jgi:hypothetical protein
MNINRRNLLMSSLFGAGYVGLRALATGLPVSFLLNPRRAIAQDACISKAAAQYFIMQTSGLGDPINANVPGMYEDPNITHSADPTMVPTNLQIGGQSYMAAQPWSTLPQTVLDRTNFWHIITDTPVHPNEPKVLGLMSTITPAEMFPSLIAKYMAPCLGTVQTQPISLGAITPSESLTFDGAALPTIPPLALKATLANAPGPLTNLQKLRDSTLDQLSELYQTGSSAAQRSFLDALVLSQTQVRNINQSLLSALDSIADNTAASQLTAAIALIQMNVSPVLTIHIPFGGDNHHDTALATEAAETVTGVATIVSLMAQLAAANLQDKVTFMSLNVFGRTVGPANTDGRQHNPNHQVSITIGKPFKGGVIGGVAPFQGDYGALAIDSTTGAGVSTGDVFPVDSLPSFGKTVLSAVGVDTATVNDAITGGKVIPAALA